MKPLQQFKIQSQLFNDFHPFRRLANLPFTAAGRPRALSVDCYANPSMYGSAVEPPPTNAVIVPELEPKPKDDPNVTIATEQKPIVGEGDKPGNLKNVIILANRIDSDDCLYLKYFKNNFRCVRARAGI